MPLLRKQSLVIDLAHMAGIRVTKVFFDASEIPYENDTFSFILSEHVLEHVYDPIKTIKEWKKGKVKETGKIFFIFTTCWKDFLTVTGNEHLTMTLC